MNSIFRVPTDGGEVLAIPEIEGAVLDGVTLEIEIEFRGSKHQGWNVASQLTFGAIGRHFIHGAQLRIERDEEAKRTNGALLYLPGCRFGRRWSALLMLGGAHPGRRRW
ncbi:MAG: hypothetical protein JSW67_09455 [Candidatus Latescibacterota bacterium]|nr:MAG: hypothetical protein JSW67_09455 [Candidatus Latescibacterota bacterium]